MYFKIGTFNPQRYKNYLYNNQSLFFIPSFSFCTFAILKKTTMTDELYYRLALLLHPKITILMPNDSFDCSEAPLVFDSEKKKSLEKS